MKTNNYFGYCDRGYIRGRNDLNSDRQINGLVKCDSIEQPIEPPEPPPEPSYTIWDSTQTTWDNTETVWDYSVV